MKKSRPKKDNSLSCGHMDYKIYQDSLWPQVVPCFVQGR